MMQEGHETIHRTLGRIEGKIDSIDKRLSKGDDTFEKLEGRVATVEKRVWFFSGALGVVTVAITTALKFLFNDGHWT